MTGQQSMYQFLFEGPQTPIVSYRFASSISSVLKAESIPCLLWGDLAMRAMGYHSIAQNLDLILEDEHLTRAANFFRNYEYVHEYPYFLRCASATATTRESGRPTPVHRFHVYTHPEITMTPSQASQRSGAQGPAAAEQGEIPHIDICLYSKRWYFPGNPPIPTGIPRPTNLSYMLSNDGRLPLTGYQHGQPNFGRFPQDIAPVIMAKPARYIETLLVLRINFGAWSEQTRWWRLTLARMTTTGFGNGPDDDPQPVMFGPLYDPECFREEFQRWWNLMRARDIEAVLAEEENMGVLLRSPSTPVGGPWVPL